MSDQIKLSSTSILWEVTPGIKKKSQAIEMHNGSSDQYGFKIKCTAKSRFAIKPSNGIIKPNQKIKIQIVLDLEKQPEVDISIKDQFCFYVLKLPENHEENENIDEYVRQHQASASSIKVNSVIQFIKKSTTQAEQGGKKQEIELKKEVEDHEEAFHSIIELSKINVDARKGEELKSEIFTSIIQKNQDCQNSEIYQSARLADAPVQHLGASSEEESERVRTLKMRVYSLEDQLKKTSVRLLGKVASGKRSKQRNRKI